MEDICELKDEIVKANDRYRDEFTSRISYIGKTNVEIDDLKKKIRHLRRELLFMGEAFEQLEDTIGDLMGRDSDLCKDIARLKEKLSKSRIKECELLTDLNELRRENTVEMFFGGIDFE